MIRHIKKDDELSKNVTSIWRVKGY